MLPSLVIKKEYRRTLQQDVVPASCPPLVPGFQPAGREIDAVMSPTSGEYRVDLPKAHSRSRLYSPPVSGTPATTKTPIPNSLAAFLPGTGQYVECDVTHSKQTTATLLPGARTVQCRAFHALSFRPTNEPKSWVHTFRAGSPAQEVAFLTGSASQTKCAVTDSKQTTDTFLTGARTAIKLSRFFHSSGSAGRSFLVLAALCTISSPRSSAGHFPPCFSSSSPLQGSSQAARSGAQQPAIPELFASGEAALRSGNLNEAETSFKRVLAQDPSSAGAYANLGVIAMRRQNWSQALDLLHKAEKLAPNIAGIRLNIGLAYYRQNEFHSATAPFESVLRDQPASVQARYLLGLCYFFTDRYADAVRVLQDLWPQESDDLNYLYVLGNAADKAGNTALQERALTRFVELGQNTAEYHLLMGKAFLNREENDKAVTELEQAVQSDPNLPFVHFNLGLAYLAHLDFARAKEEFEKDIALEPDVAFNYDRLGLVYVYLQDDEKAEQNFREALRRDSHLASSYFGLARVYQHEKKFDEALVAVDSARKIDPDNPNYHNLKGQILLRTGGAKEGQAELDTATRLLNASRARRQNELSGEALPQPELTAEPKP